MKDKILAWQPRHVRRRNRPPRLLLAGVLAGMVLLALAVMLAGPRHASAVEDAFRQATEHDWAARIVVVGEASDHEAFTVEFDLFFIDTEDGEVVERLRAQYPMAPAAADDVEARRRSFARAFDSLAQGYGIPFLGVVWPDLSHGGPHPQLDSEAYLWRFHDLPGHWVAATVEALAVKDMVAGYGDDRFRPEAAVTRAELLKLLETATGAHWDEERRDGDYWAWDLVLRAWEDHIFNLDDYEERAFYPDLAAPRWEVAVLAVNALTAAMPGGADVALDQEQAAAALAEQFADAGQIPAHARRHVYLALEWGLMEGRGPQQFGPEEESTRAEAAVLIERLLAHLD